MTIAEKIERARADIDAVYNSGVENGREREYDKFWDVIQQHGRRVDYKFAFAGVGWTETNFYPKYDLTISNGTSTFHQCNFKGNLKERLEECGVEMRFTGSSFANTFVDCDMITELPEIDASRATTLGATFQNMGSLVTLPIILPTATRVNWNSTFNICKSLVNLTLTGKIYDRNGSSINLSWSKLLSKASIENVIECLDTSVVDQYITLSLTAVNNAFETSEGAADGSTSTEWANLIATRSNWTINLLDN